MINNKKWYVIFAISKTIKIFDLPDQWFKCCLLKILRIQTRRQSISAAVTKATLLQGYKKWKKNLKRFIVCTCVYTPIKWYNTREMYWSNCVNS